MQQGRNAGIHGRQNDDDVLGSLIHPPGYVGQNQRNMNIDAICVRVVSQGGNVVAGAKLYVRVSVCASGAVAAYLYFSEFGLDPSSV